LSSFLLHQGLLAPVQEAPQVQAPYDKKTLKLSLRFRLLQTTIMYAPCSDPNHRNNKDIRKRQGTNKGSRLTKAHLIWKCLHIWRLKKTAHYKQNDWFAKLALLKICNFVSYIGTNVTKVGRNWNYIFQQKYEIMSLVWILWIV
jgi:hypothetical protein